jgi:hypothetical protein
MGYTNFPNGITSFGEVVGSSRFSSPWATHYFVDGDDGSDGNTGLSPDRAIKTIQTAVNLAGAQDIIYIRPKSWDFDKGFNRYQEDVTITGGRSSNTFLNANMSIIGVTAPGSQGDDVGVRWKHNSTVNLTNEAPALHLENIGFFSEGATYGVHLSNDAATLTKQGSNGTSLYNCAFKGKGLYVLHGGSGLNIVKCRFQCAWDGTVAALQMNCTANSGRRFTVRDCDWLDGNSTAPSAQCIQVLAPCTEILITGCNFPQLPTGNIYIATSGANYGLISNCFFNEDNLDTDAEITLGTGVVAVACWDKAGIATTA